MGGSCKDGCAGLFVDFTFERMQTARPPKSKGVYVIRSHRRGAPTKDVGEASTKLVKLLQWPVVERKMLSRLDRLSRITDCDILYVGSAGTRDSSKHTLDGRYRDFGGRHTAMYPIWALLVHEWELDYGWLETANPEKAENDLKARYRALHAGFLPSLVVK